MGCCMGWIAAAGLLGFLLGAGLLHRRIPLRRRCRSIGVYRGRILAEVMALLGGPAQTEQMLPDGRVLRTWRQGGYAITLAFDGDGLCQGVYEEQG